MLKVCGDYSNLKSYSTPKRNYFDIISKLCAKALIAIICARLTVLVS